MTSILNSLDPRYALLFGGQGSAWRRALDESLALPELIFPVLGLLVGHPDQEPQFKPRLPLEVIAGENTYPGVDSYADLIAEYDTVITRYYDLRDASTRVESFTNMVRTSIGTGGAHVSPMLDVLREQGFALR